MTTASTISDHPDLSETSVVVLGAGTMGGAFVRAVRAAGAPAERVRVVNSSDDSSRRAAETFEATPGSWDDLADADVVVLGVKPYQLGDVLPQVAGRIGASTLVVSLAAGTTLATLAEGLGGHAEVVRAMPNTPMAVGEGVTHLMAGADASESAVGLARALLSASGRVLELPEEKVHAMIGVSGSGVAFVFTVIDAMVDEAVRQGVTRPDATAAVLQTVRGAAELLERTGDHPAVARSNVMSPGGTTAQGVAALEAHGIRSALAAAMTAAADTSRRMAGE